MPSSLAGRVAGAAAALAMLEAAHLHGARVVWTAHNARPTSRGIRHSKPGYWSAVVRRVDAVIHPSEAGRQAVAARYPELARTSPRGCAPWDIFAGSYPDTVSREEARAAMGIPQGVRVVGFLGLVRPYKNVPHLIRTVRLLPPGADEVILLVGGAPHSAALADEIRAAAGDDPRVRLTWRMCPTPRCRPTFARPISWSCRFATSPTPGARCSPSRSTGRCWFRVSARWASFGRWPGRLGAHLRWRADARCPGRRYRMGHEAARPGAEAGVAGLGVDRASDPRDLLGSDTEGNQPAPRGQVMRLSVVVCTRNRAPQLRACLERIGRLSVAASWELVVVNNGSTDETADVLHQFRRVFLHPLTVVEEPRPGLGMARNRGWRAAAGELIGFTDDDCYPADDYLISGRRLLRGPVARVSGRAGRAIRSDGFSDHDPGARPPSRRRAQRVCSGGPDSRGELRLPEGGARGYRRIRRRLRRRTPFCCEDVDALARAAAWAAAAPTIRGQSSTITTAARRGTRRCGFAGCTPLLAAPTT